jgi:cytochrome P450 family 6
MFWSQKGNIAFGLDCNCLENPNTDFRKYGKTFFKVDTPASAIKWLFVNSFQKLSRKMGFMLNQKDAADFFLKVFAETIKYREENKIERNDFVELLLQMKNKGMLTFKEIAAESFIFYVGEPISIHHLIKIL